MGSYAGDGGVYQSEVSRTKPQRQEQLFGTVREPARDVPIIRDTDVLVIGGGPSGTAAALAAGRLGARVLLIERYNHLGGLSTGGLVVWIDRMTDWSGSQIIGGIGQELLDRLPKDAILGPATTDWGKKDPALVAEWKPRFAAFHDIVTWSPMIDPEQLKAVSLTALREAGVEVLFHCWAAEAIVDDNTVRGAIIQSKQGRIAVTARIVIDTTGDGDIFASANEASSSDVDESNIHQCMNTSWLWASVDIATWLNFRRSDRFPDFANLCRSTLGFLETPVPSWRNDVAVFMGPRYAGFNALNVTDLTTVELKSRDAMMALLDFYRREAPGFENAWILLTAPQIGIRQSRRLVGQYVMTRQDWHSGVIHDDEIGISPSLSPSFKNVSVPYGSLLPKSVKGLLVAGRHLSSDASSHTFMREIPQCWLTGQAAGTAAYVALNSSKAPHDVPANELQSHLKRGNVILHR